MKILCGESGTTVLITPAKVLTAAKSGREIYQECAFNKLLINSLTGCTHVVRHAGHRLVVMWSPDLQALPLEVDSVEGHRLGRLVDRAELEERKVLVQVYLARQDGVTCGLRQSGEVHLLVEELHHLLLSHPKRDIAYVQATSLAGDCRAHDGHCRLGRVGDNVCGNLPGRLHGLVLQRGDVLEAGRGNVPVQRGLSTARPATPPVRGA